MKKLFFIIFVFVLIILSINLISPNIELGLSSKASAQTPEPTKVKGWLWSDNIGWISLDSVSATSSIDYGVNRDATTGELIGYAWSDNIGWIKFDPSFTGPDGLGRPATIAKSGDQQYTVSGWARACAGTVSGDCMSASRTDGWDGWISFSGTWENPSNGSSGLFGTIVRLVGSILTFEGYGWAGNVVGWISPRATLEGGDYINVSLIAKKATDTDAGYRTNLSITTTQNSEDINLKWSLNSNMSPTSITCRLSKGSVDIFSGVSNGSDSDISSGNMGNGVSNNISINRVETSGPATDFSYICSSGSITAQSDASVRVTLRDTITPPGDGGGNPPIPPTTPITSCPSPQMPVYNTPNNPASGIKECICPSGMIKFGNSCRVNDPGRRED